MKRKGIFNKIREVVTKIPKNKVVTYGNVARAAGISNARIVGWALRGNRDPNIPCHRVVKKDGFLANNYSIGGWQEQKQRLKAEGISFTKENQVDMEKHRWQTLKKR